MTYEILMHEKLMHPFAVRPATAAQNNMEKMEK